MAPPAKRKLDNQHLLPLHPGDDLAAALEDDHHHHPHPHHHVDHDALPVFTTTTNNNNKRRKSDDSGMTWNDFLFELVLYKAIHGDLRPKAKDDEHKRLHDWMVRQRKEFKVYQDQPEKSELTQEQVKVLDSLQFPWNTRGDEHWYRNYEHLKTFREHHGHVMVPRTFQDVPNLCHWVTDQRRQLKYLKQGKPTAMTKERQRLLDEIGFVWQVRNRTTWDTRFNELVAFKQQKGTTIVPQHFSENKALGKWVAKQREQYKLLKKGEHSFLTPDRLDQLNSIGFVWSMKGRSPKEDEDLQPNAVAVAPAPSAIDSVTVEIVDPVKVEHDAPHVPVPPDTPMPHHVMDHHAHHQPYHHHHHHHHHHLHPHHHQHPQHHPHHHQPHPLPAQMHPHPHQHHPHPHPHPHPHDQHHEPHHEHEEVPL